jgi:S1-C subfamily serine protease
MLSRLVRVALIVAVFVKGGPLAAQTVLEQLEQKLQAGQNPPAPAVQLPAGQEPGYLGLVADGRQTAGTGVRVLEVMGGAPADQAGVKAGDLITGIDNRPVRSMDDFAGILSGQPAGARVSIAVQRDGATKNLDATLSKRPPPGERRFEQFGPIPEAVAPPPGDTRPTLLGVQVATVTPEVQAALNVPTPSGALVVAVVEGSPAQRAGVPAGAVIVAVDGKPVERPLDLSRLVAEAGPGREIRLAYYTQGALSDRVVRLDGPTSQAAAKPITSAPAPAPAVLEPAGPSPAATSPLEQRVLDLERRLSELERKIGSASPSTP